MSEPTAAKPTVSNPTGAKPLRSPVLINRASVLRLSANVLLMLALWFLASKLAEWAQETIEERFRENVDPHVKKELDKLAPEAERLYAEDPTAPVYLHNTIKVSWYQLTSPYGDVTMGFNDVEHAGPVTVGRDQVAEDQIVWHRTRAAEYQSMITYYTSRVTDSIPLQFNESPEQRDARTMAFRAKQDAEGGRSVRPRAETYERASTNEPGDTEDKAGRSAGIKAWKIRWTRAYLQYTKGRPHLKELHIDALRYLDELEGRASPARDSIVNPRLDPAGRKQLEEWMRGS